MSSCRLFDKYKFFGLTDYFAFHIQASSSSVSLAFGKQQTPVSNSLDLIGGAYPLSHLGFEPEPPRVRGVCVITALSSSSGLVRIIGSRFLSLVLSDSQQCPLV